MRVAAVELRKQRGEAEIGDRIAGAVEQVVLRMAQRERDGERSGIRSPVS